MRKIVGIIAVSALLMAVFAYPGLAQEGTTAERDVKIIGLEGTAGIKRAGQTEWLEAAMGDVLKSGDTLRTDPMSNITLNVDGSGETAVVRISENAELILSTLTLDTSSGTKQTLLDLAIGSVLIKASQLEAESKFEVNTPTSIVGVRGTTFEVRVSAAE